MNLFHLFEDFVHAVKINGDQNITLCVRERLEVWLLTQVLSQTALILAEAHVFDIKFQRRKSDRVNSRHQEQKEEQM